MTTRRYSTNGAPTQQISAGINNTAVSVTAPSFSGWPTQFPFSAVFELGTANMEIVLVTNIVGTTATITRAQEGTTAINHATGATFDHCGTALDLNEASAHTSANAGVHGVTGNVVGTSDVQTLTNKTIKSMQATTTAGTAVITATAAASGDKLWSGRDSTNTEKSNILDTGIGTFKGGLLAGSSNQFAVNGGGAVQVGSFTNQAAVTSPTAGMMVWLTAPTGGFGPGFFAYDGSQWLPYVQGAWVSYTPTITASTGTLTTVSATGSYSVVGKTMNLHMDITVTTNGTGASSIHATLPAGFTYNSTNVGVGRADGVSAKQLQTRVNPTFLYIVNYDGTYPASSGEVLRCDTVIQLG